MSTTWKQVVLDVADAWREANDSTAKIPVGQLPNKVKEGGENIDPEMTTLEGTLQEILEILPFKGAMASGQYVWKKLTAEGGTFIEFVISDDSTAYPDGGTKDGFWFELVKEGIDFSNTAVKKIAVDKFTMAADTAGSSGIKINHSLGELPRAAVIIGEITKCANTNSNYFNVHTCVMINLSNKHGAQISIGYNYQNTEKRVALASDSAWSNPSETQVQYYDGSSYTILPAGIEFTLITMA